MGGGEQWGRGVGGEGERCGGGVVGRKKGADTKGFWQGSEMGYKLAQRTREKRQTC